MEDLGCIFDFFPQFAEADSPFPCLIDEHQESSDSSDTCTIELSSRESPGSPSSAMPSVAPTQEDCSNLATTQIYGIPGAPSPSLSRRGGSKKRKDPDLSAVQDEEERKRLERKLRNKESAQNSRDRQKNHIAQLETALQTASYQNMSLQQQLQEQMTENRCLKERLRQAELLLKKHNIDLELLTNTDALSRGASRVPITSTHTNNLPTAGHQPLLNITHFQPDKGLLGGGFMTLVLALAFALTSDLPTMNYAPKLCDSTRAVCQAMGLSTPFSSTTLGARRLLDADDLGSIGYQALSPSPQ